MTNNLVAFGTKSRQRAAAARAERRRPARIARRLALAHALQRRIDGGEFADYAAVARALGFTRARVTQIMDLLLVAPDIQEEILHLEVAPGAPQISERTIRDRVLRSLDWAEQRLRWTAVRSSHISR